jgi:hypothetical protein
MSEGSITYQVEGAECGIRTVINSQLKSHNVCNDGLTCMRTDVGNGAEVKQCHSTNIVSGERCVPTYDNCYGTMECITSPIGTYTCGGTLPWSGNADYVDSGYVQQSSYHVNTALIVLGVCILFFYMAAIAWEWIKTDDDDSGSVGASRKSGKIKDGNIYPNRFNDGM